MVRLNGHSLLGKVMSDRTARIQQLSPDRQRALARLVSMRCEDGSDTTRPKLCAFVVPDGSGCDHDQLKDRLKSELPDYMVSDHFVTVTELPRHSSGKLNISALPYPSIAPTANAGVTAPRSPTEQTLAQIWSDLLGLAEVSVHDDFFEGGGDSIISIQVLSRARQAGILLQPQDFTETTTIATLAAAASDIDEATNVCSQSDESTSHQYLFRLDGIGNNILYSEVRADSNKSSLRESKLVRFDKQYARETPLEQMAEDYVRMIREIQPSGPYRFISLDCGAHVTYEVAQQLIQAGETLAFFGVVEADPPVMSQSVVLKYIKKGIRYLKRADFRGLARGLRLTFRRGIDLTPRTAPSGEVLPFNHGLTINNYLPTVYAGRITVFQSKTYHKQHGGRDKIRQWNELASGGVDSVLLEAEYPLDILLPANIGHLEKRLTPGPS